MTRHQAHHSSVATVIGRFCNTGELPLDDVQGFIGAFNMGSPEDSTPGIYPQRDSTDPAFVEQHPHLEDTGVYAFTHVGGRKGTADAQRYIGALDPGECRSQYWHFTYPRRGNPDNSGAPVWGETRDPLACG
ncbi:MAG TPA: hypothetical protein VK879_04805 [Candidatus Sulfomarinibacteraceae bacterium]|nr:hypothetical protein [Candidatus Sulfomarinibacteraceae bacterium]